MKYIKNVDIYEILENDNMLIVQVIRLLKKLGYDPSMAYSKEKIKEIFSRVRTDFLEINFDIYGSFINAKNKIKMKILQILH